MVKETTLDGVKLITPHTNHEDYRGTYVELYNRGGVKNPHLDPKIEPLHLSPAEVDALVAFMLALDGEGYQDIPPAAFPQ